MKQPGGGGGGGGGQVTADLVGGRAGGVGANRLSSFQVRQFQGVNLTDTRATIEDTEFAWLENIIPIGGGLARIVPGPEPPIATFAAPTGKPLLWSFIFGTVPYVYILGTDGSLTQVAIPTGTVTVVGGPGSFTYGGTDLAGWQDSTLLLISPAGYRSWVPPAGPLNVIDAAKNGYALETFQGRAWLARTGRTIEFTAPNTFTDFTAANGAGTVTISDNVFPGNLSVLLNALEQLWIIGPGAINAISNVQTTGAPAVTTFSLTNIVTNVGTVLGRTVSTLFRTVLFNTQYGVYAIVGATPQKLSAKLDGLYLDLKFDGTEHAAIGSVENVFTWMTRVTYWGEGSPRELLLCYASGKWFFASTPSLTNLVGVLVNGVPQIWATRHDGTSLALFQLFADPEVPVAYKAVTKLYDLGRSWQTKQLLRVGLELQAPPPITGGLTVTADNEYAGRVTPLVFETPSGLIIFVGTGPITFIGTGPITWVGDASGLALARGGALGTTIGRYLGLTLSGTAPAWTLSAFLMQVRPSTDEEWA